MESQLTVTDISAAATLIDLAMARGAFKAAEAASIGQLYTKLTAFVDMVNQQAEAAKQAQEEAATQTPAETAEAEAEPA